MLQAISVPLQLALQAPIEQKGVAPEQALPQPPQLAASDMGFVHDVPHKRSPPVQAQALFEHVCKLPHTVPHLPQLLRSTFRSTQAVPVAVPGE